MNSRFARALTRLYAADWQARYGEEFTVVLEALPPTAGTIFDTLWFAARSRSRTLAGLALLSACALLLSSATSATTSSNAVERNIARRQAVHPTIAFACRSYSSATDDGWIARQTCLD